MKYLTFYERTVLENIGEFQDYNISEPKTNFNKVLTVYNIFKSEFIHDNNKHIGQTELFTEWLQGLPNILTVPFENFVILENAKKEGFKLDTEQLKNNFLDMYWHNLSNAFFTLKNNL